MMKVILYYHFLLSTLQYFNPLGLLSSCTCKIKLRYPVSLAPPALYRAYVVVRWTGT